MTVTLRLEPDAISVSLAHAALPPEELEAYAARIPRDGEEKEPLRALLATVKSRYTHSDTIVVLPSAGITYRAVVELLDAARNLPDDDGGEVPLFPVVVLSRSP